MTKKTSKVDTIDIYEMVCETLNSKDMAYSLSRLHDLMGKQYYVDTGVKIGAALHGNHRHFPELHIDHYEENHG